MSAPWSTRKPRSSTPPPMGIAGPDFKTREEEKPQWKEDVDGSIWLAYDVKWVFE